MNPHSTKADSSLQEEVISEFKWNPRVSAEGIIATVNDGIVTLRGTVPHFSEKQNAEQVAQHVLGVRAVIDEIKVNILGAYGRTDQQIAEAALSALEWSYSVPEDIKVSVEQGWITLAGETEWDYQRVGAKNAVSQLWGVCGVTNNIKLKEKTQSSDIKIRIEEALRRSVDVEGKKIAVLVKGNKVTLTGNVYSCSERKDAQLAAWMAPGIMSVENKLKIS